MYKIHLIDVWFRRTVSLLRYIYKTATMHQFKIFIDDVLLELIEELARRGSYATIISRVKSLSFLT